MATTMPLHARQSGGTGSASAEDQQLMVAVQDGRLSVRTGAVPLATVLRAIEQATDLSIIIEGDLGNVRAQAFQGLAVAESLRRLVSDRHALVMVYATDRDRSETRSLEEVRVYSEAQQAMPEEQPPSSVRAASPPARTRQVEAGAPAERYLYGSDSAGRKEAAKQLEQASDDAVPVLTAALDDPEDEVRLRALRALRALQGDAALEHLSKVARRDPDPQLRQAAIYMLGGIAAGEASRILQAALADPDERVRQAAAQTFSQLRAR